MRSCEYSTTDQAETKKTKLLTINNIRFFDHDSNGFLTDLPHSTPTSTLAAAGCVSITFENQKNGEKDATITQHRTSGNNICPVTAWAALVKRILAYPKTTTATTVNTFLTQGKLVRFTSKQVSLHLKHTVKQIGESRLGVNCKKVGTRSLRTSAAMLLYLSNVRTSTIMLLGRWKSDAFLLYLRRQVKEFTAGVTNQMTSQPDMFFAIPDQTTEDLPERLVATRDDPMTSNSNSTASRARFNGLASRESTSHVNSAHNPAFNVWG